ncbi:MAG: 2-hydroxymuconate tautomerase [Cardiobacteriaceae bacterium]|nr:2-hydroxymuconate tautomerase [Cardiobacteriaceae bacterium]
MPVVNIKLVEGRTVEQKRELVKQVTAAIVNSIGVPESSVWISIDDMKAENFAQAGVLRCDK